jgi:mRNA interferase MazF
MVIRQGDLFWVDQGEPSGSAPGYLRPYVVVQNDLYNQSRIQTLVLCALTSNLLRSRLPGNILLDEGEGNLPKRSVVNVSQISTVDKEDLGEKIGTLSAERVQEILEGIYLMLEPRDTPL